MWTTTTWSTVSRGRERAWRDGQLGRERQLNFYGCRSVLLEVSEISEMELFVNRKGGPFMSSLIHTLSPSLQCSRTCGAENRTRSVTCTVNGQPSTKCNKSAKPSNTSSCEHPTCRKWSYMQQTNIQCLNHLVVHPNSMGIGETAFSFSQLLPLAWTTPLFTVVPLNS